MDSFIKKLMIIQMAKYMGKSGFMIQVTLQQNFIDFMNFLILLVLVFPFFS